MFFHVIGVWEFETSVGSIFIYLTARLFYIVIFEKICVLVVYICVWEGFGLLYTSRWKKGKAYEEKEGIVERKRKFKTRDNLSIEGKLNLVLMKFDGKRLTEIWETKINYSKLKKPQTNRRLI